MAKIWGVAILKKSKKIEKVDDVKWLKVGLKLSKHNRKRYIVK